MNIEEYILNNLDIIDIKPTEVIVVKFTYGETPLDALNELIISLQNKFPKNNIVAVPQCMEFEVCDIEWLEKYVDKIRVFVDDLKENFPIKSNF